MVILFIHVVLATLTSRQELFLPSAPLREPYLQIKFISRQDQGAKEKV